ncbi:3-dehydroquinate synthase [Bacteroidia bacterium]|nr:3-dehydroquinate synthase [Bacteroidia bacterium]GHV70359.1 3-dehydroquinate synthase [Bacteroidia bacterium]
MKQQIIRCTNIEKDLAQFISDLSYDGLFLLTDENTHKLCLPLIESVPEIRTAKQIIIPAGDENKNIRSLSMVWEFLSQNGANRKSLLINLGGGMLTDLGGFAAATFKRGIRFINIPTTLLGAVDAAVGGKTGINFKGLKNEIGAFAPALAVLIDSNFFKTLDATNLLSGYAEMLKHALLNSEQELNEILRFDLENPDYQKLNSLLFESVLVKERIVTKDPTEQGIRKALNLGHTFGHAFESFSYEIKRPVPHGYAVAWGTVCELYLSLVKLGFDKDDWMKVARFVKAHYGVFAFDCTHYQRLYELMQHDKKNETTTINFSLLKKIGEIEINQTANQQEIDETLDFFREYFGL